MSWQKQAAQWRRRRFLKGFRCLNMQVGAYVCRDILKLLLISRFAKPTGSLACCHWAFSKHHATASRLLRASAAWNVVWKQDGAQLCLLRVQAPSPDQQAWLRQQPRDPQVRVEGVLHDSIVLEVLPFVVSERVTWSNNTSWSWPCRYPRGRRWPGRRWHFCPCRAQGTGVQPLPGSFYRSDSRWGKTGPKLFPQKGPYMGSTSNKGSPWQLVFNHKPPLRSHLRNHPSLPLLPRSALGGAWRRQALSDGLYPAGNTGRVNSHRAWTRKAKRQ